MPITVLVQAASRLPAHILVLLDKSLAFLVNQRGERSKAYEALLARHSVCLLNMKSMGYRFGACVLECGLLERTGRGSLSSIFGPYIEAPRDYDK
jgi:hypothetical protein